MTTVKIKQIFHRSLPPRGHAIAAGLLAAILILGAAPATHAQYPQALSIDYIVAEADQIFIGRVVNVGDTTRDNKGRRSGTIVLSVEKTLKGNEVRGSLALPVANWDPDYPGEFFAPTSDTQINSHQLLVAFQHDAKGRSSIRAIDLDSPSLEIIRADLVVLKTSAEVIRAAEREVRRILPGENQIAIFELRSPTYEIKGDPYYACMIIVPVDERLEKLAHGWLSDPSTRLHGIYALHFFKSDENIHLLTSLLTDPDNSVRRDAEKLLKDWGVDAANPAPQEETNYGAQSNIQKPSTPSQALRITNSSDVRTPPDAHSKLAFSDADHLYAIGNQRAILYISGDLLIQSPSPADARAMFADHIVNFEFDDELRAISPDGRKMIVAAGMCGIEPHLVFLDTLTSRREEIPRGWYDPGDFEVDAAFSGDDRLLSIYSESGTTEAPAMVSVYDWPTQTLVATRYSIYISAGGGFGGDITADGQIEFVNNRVGRKLVDLKTGRLLGWFGMDSVRSPDGKWVVEFPNLSFNETAPKEVLVKDGANAQPRGKLNLDSPLTDDDIYGSMNGAFCGNTSRLVVARANEVSLYAIPSGNLLANFPVSSWRNPRADERDVPTVACSPTGTRVAILSGSRLTFHDLK
jgi:hypothetical protein